MNSGLSVSGEAGICGLVSSRQQAEQSLSTEPSILFQLYSTHTGIFLQINISLCVWALHPHVGSHLVHQKCTFSTSFICGDKKMCVLWWHHSLFYDPFLFFLFRVSPHYRPATCLFGKLHKEKEESRFGTGYSVEPVSRKKKSVHLDLV